MITENVAHHTAPHQLTVNKTELAALLGISRPLVYQVVRQADFPKPLRINSKELYLVDDVRDWIAKQTKG